MIQPGTVLGHYEVLAPLGKGGMGEVYRAKDQKLGREVAIKVLPDTFGDDPVRVARFDREARAAAALNHPNICAIHEVGEHEGLPFIVMELLKGHTLEARLSRQAPLEGNEVLELGTQLAEALDAAHAAGIVHRDIKPANLQDDTVARAAATWSLDDRHVLFVPAGAFGGDLSEVDISTGKIRQLTVGVNVSNAILSSKGRIVFSRWSHETFFFKMLVDNPASEHEQISLSAGNNFAQRFSPDGRQIVFQSARAGRSMLWLHDVETGMERQLTYPTTGREDRTPDWSPDGKQVVFLSNRDGPFQLWVADVDGEATHRLSSRRSPWMVIGG